MGCWWQAQFLVMTESRVCPGQGWLRLDGGQGCLKRRRSSTGVPGCWPITPTATEIGSGGSSAGAGGRSPPPPGMRAEGQCRGSDREEHTGLLLISGPGGRGGEGEVAPLAGLQGGPCPRWGQASVVAQRSGKYSEMWLRPWCR